MNKKNRIVAWLCVVLTVLMVVSVIPAGAISVSIDGVTPNENLAELPNGSGDITINTGNPALDDSVPVGNPGEGYVPVGTAINSTEGFNNMEPDGKYYLAADIVVDTTFQGFTGVFDGNGHTVKTTVPLFNAPQGATIKNLVVENLEADGYISTANNTAAVASGTSFECNFFNILTRADVGTTSTATGVSTRAAGIAGRTGGYTIFERCTNEGDLSGNDICGGMTSLVSTDDGSYAVFINCVNKGNITTGNSSAGGIAASVEGPAGTTVFYNCRNEGDVTSPGGAGGILSYTTNTQGLVKLRMYGCTNKGVITSTGSHAAGMVSYATVPTTIENCINEQDGKILAGTDNASNQDKGGGMVGYSTGRMFISGCKNHAPIDGAGQTGGIGGWLFNTNVTVQNCQNYGAVTSRKNYAGGIVARSDNGADYNKEVNTLIADCTNEGDVTSYTGTVAGICTYSQAPATFIRCVNKGKVSAREDTPANIGVTAGGIAGNYVAPLTVIDCRNEGAVTGKGQYTVDESGTVTAQSSGNAGGIVGSSGGGDYRGVTRLIGCVNTGAVTSGENKVANPGHGSMYAGGLVGYQWGGGSAAYLIAQYCISTGNVTGASNAGYILGYTNSTYGVFTDNVFAGTVTSTGYPTGINAKGSSVLNVVTWNNASQMDESLYDRNWVVETFNGTYINDTAGTNGGNPLDMSSFADYRFGAAEDPFAVMNTKVLAENPRDTVEEISTADQFLAMSQYGNYKLVADITLNASYAKCFLGTFDGGNHTITVNGKPVFGTFGVSAVISNLTIEGTEITNADTTGALGTYGGATFINICNKVNVTVTTTNNAGGIVGSTSGQLARFENCVNMGKITHQAGSAAGIVGSADSLCVMLIGCKNIGEITSTKYAGGMVGEAQISKAGNPTLQDCVNTGKITSTGTSGNVGAGGMVAYNGTAPIYLKNCLNTGELNGMMYAGGMIADSAKGFSMTNCINTGNVTATKSGAGGIYNHHSDSGCTLIELNGCINTGKVNCPAYAGGMAGTSNAIKANTNHIFQYCINVGEIVGGSVNTGGLVGYAYAGGNIGVTILNCIVAGTVTTTADRAGALAGYSNTATTNIQNNVIVCPVSAKTSTHVYLATGLQKLYSGDASTPTGYTNIAKNNMVKPGIAQYDTQNDHGNVKLALKKNSSGTVDMNDFAIDSTVTGAMLLLAGINPDENGKFSSAFDSFLPEENHNGNQVAVINAAGATVATVTSLTEAVGYLTNGATIKLLADYYTAIPENLNVNGISYTLDGNDFNFYGANSSTQYMLNFNGFGTAVVKNLTVRTEIAGVKVGCAPRRTQLDVTFENVKVYAGGANENGFSRYTAAKAFYMDAALSTVTFNGAETFFKNASNIIVQDQNGVLNINNGTYAPRGAGLETWGKNAVVNIYGGNFVGTDNYDSMISSGNGVINIFDGKFSNNGMCVARVLGGKTKTETVLENEILTETNATLNIFGGVLTLVPGAADGWHHAVIRCGGGSTYGTVNIEGGTFINQKTKSSQTIFKNNTCSSLNIKGGLVLSVEGPAYFVRTNGCANITTESGYSPADSRGNAELSKYSGNYTFEGKSYKAWKMFAATDSKYAMTTEYGAQVRMTAGSTGLRFISTITADKIAAAKALAGEGGSVSYGTVIAPMDYVMQADAFTMAALDAATALQGKTSKYLNIAAKEGLTEDEEGNVEIRAAITNIKAENLTRAFAAIAYVKVVDAKGATTYYYGEFDGASNVRSICQVAEAALADTSTEQTGEYRYAVTTEDGNTVYSRYSESARNILKTFIV